MDSITRIKEFIKSNFPDWEKISFSEFQESIDFRDDLSELYKINHEEIILISYSSFISSASSGASALRFRFKPSQ
mgnify:CR=1 FL=1